VSVRCRRDTAKRYQPTTSYLELTLAYLLLGTGLGVVNPPITATALSSMPADQAGAAAGAASSARQIGNVIGVAVMGAMLNTTPHSATAHTAHLVSPHADLRDAWPVGSGCGSGFGHPRDCPDYDARADAGRELV
jgi:MFS family permease